VTTIAAHEYRSARAGRKTRACFRWGFGAIYVPAPHLRTPSGWNRFVDAPRGSTHCTIHKRRNLRSSPEGGTVPAMCGIAGIAFRNGSRVAVDLARRASETLAHRGPDDHGYLGWSKGAAARTGRDAGVVTGAQIALLHRRLSILDLSSAGWQPFADSKDQHFIVFNGEIYNYLELREELEKEGVVFRSHSDTEVLLAALATWDTRALPRLIGMFAFAWLDTLRHRLVLARDPFGIKPLLWTRDEARFVFASEPGALLALAQLAPRPNPQRLYDYLRFGITDHGSESMLAGVHQVPAGSALTLDLERPLKPELRRYIDLEPGAPLELSFEEAAAGLRERFLESVRLHLRSDVPVGTALSGGIDSSSILAAMRHAEGARLELHAFSYVAEDPALSEERWIELAGQAAGAVVHKVRPQAEELVADMDDLLEAQGEPFGSTSIYAQYRVFRLAREAGIKVMLDGQGADELLAGYDPFVAGRLASLLRRGQLRAAVRLARSAGKTRGLRLPPLLARTFGLLLPSALEGPARGLVGQELAPPWLNEDWFVARGVRPEALGRRRGRELLRARLVDSLLETSLPMLLRYEDRNSMHFSIESRVPFLTVGIAQFILALPEEHLIAPDATSKSVFRAAMRGIVPDPILDRRDKIGFATPERRWLGTLRPWVEAVLGSDAARGTPVLRPAVLRTEWQRILEGRRPFDFRVWRWINLIHWSERLRVSFGD